MKLTDIQLAVCEEFEITLTQMVSRSRKKEFVLPRHVAMGLCRELTQKTLMQVAKVFKRADHTTVMHGIGKYQAMLDDEELAPMIYRIEKRLK